MIEACERLGSPRAASRELGLAVSTVYRRIAAFEAATGVSCLVRGKGLTRAAHEFALIARSTDAAMRAAAGRIASERSACKGRVTLTTLDGFIPLLAAPLADVARSHPHLRVDVVVSDTGVSLRRRRAEIGLALLDAPPPTLVGRRLFQVPFAVYGNKHTAAHPEDARWVVLGHPLGHTWLASWEAAYIPADRIAASTASRLLLVDLVLAGAGLGLLPTPLAELHPALIRVSSFRAGLAELTRHAWVLFPEEHRRDPRVRAVVDGLCSHFRSR